MYVHAGTYLHIFTERERERERERDEGEIDSSVAIPLHVFISSGRSTANSPLDFADARSDAAEWGEFGHLPMPHRRAQRLYRSLNVK